MKNTTIRTIEPADYAALSDFLYHAVFRPQGLAPLPRAIVQKPEIALYAEGFDDERGDLGVVAEQGGGIIAAAWTRIIPAYGHIDDDTPELAVSVLPEYRNSKFHPATGRGILEWDLPAVCKKRKRG